MSEKRVHKFQGNDMSVPRSWECPDWLKQMSLPRSIGSDNYQYGISELASQTSFCRETCRGAITKRRLFSKA